jgi:Rrf2 family protein
MQLSRTVEYALHATLQLARDDSGIPVSSSKLAAVGVMPERFLLQVLRLLVTHGLLRSTRGVDGGYSLARSPADITLLDVIEAVEGPLVIKAPSEQTLPDPTWTALRATLQNAVAVLRAEYSKLTLAQVMADDNAARAVAARSAARTNSDEAPAKAATGELANPLHNSVPPTGANLRLDLGVPPLISHIDPRQAQIDARPRT